MVDARARDRALQLRLGRRESHRSDGADRADDGPAGRIGPAGPHLAPRRRAAGGWLQAEEVVRVAQVHRLAVKPGLGESDVDAGIAAELAWQQAGRLVVRRRLVSRVYLPRRERRSHQRAKDRDNDDKHGDPQPAGGQLAQPIHRRTSLNDKPGRYGLSASSLLEPDTSRHLSYEADQLLDCAAA